MPSISLTADPHLTARLSMAAHGPAISTRDSETTPNDLARSTSRTTVAQLAGAVRQPGEFDHVAELDWLVAEIATSHLDRCVPLTAPARLQAVPIDEHAIRAQYEREALEGVSAFKRSQRAAARTAAIERAEAEIAKRRDEATIRAEKDHRHRLEAWERLVANEPRVVTANVAAALRTRELPAVPVGLDGSSITIVISLPTPAELVPSRTAIVGAGVIHPRNETERGTLWFAIVASVGLAVAREAVAVAPGLTRVSLLILRTDPTIMLATPVIAASFAPEDLTAERIRGPEAFATFAGGSAIQRLASGDLGALSGRDVTGLASVAHAVTEPLGLALDPTAEAV